MNAADNDNSANWTYTSSNNIYETTYDQRGAPGAPNEE